MRLLFLFVDKQQIPKCVLQNKYKFCFPTDEKIVNQKYVLLYLFIYFYFQICLDITNRDIPLRLYLFNAQSYVKIITVV